MEITSYVLGPLETNTYLAWDSETLDVIIIDPADEGQFICEEILRLQLNPTAIVLTHGHIDHIMGIIEPFLNFSLPIYLHKKDSFLYERAQSTAQHWFNRTIPSLPTPTHFLEEGDLITFGNERLRVATVPGHTPGSVALHNNAIMFGGDVLFKNGVGRTDFKYANPMQLWKSIEKMKKIGSGTLLYPGHGDAFYLD